MLLTIDCGNTNTVFAVIDGDNVVGTWRSATNNHRTHDEYAVWLTQLMALQDIVRKDIHAAVIASVVPESTHNLARLCRRYFDCDPVIVGDPSIDYGIRILTDRPEEVGADRIVNALAAYERFQCPLIIIDFGTATTFDVINKDGDYCGGVIAPGINLSLEALYMRAAKLPGIAVRQPEKIIGRNTVESMESGIFWGYVGLIEGLVKRISKEYDERFGGRPKVVATGGLAVLFQNATDIIEKIDRDLTLRGLQHIYRRNTTPKELP